jgi:hypothetical protein
MSTGMRTARYAGIILLCLGTWVALGAAETQKKAAKKPPPLPPLPTGPTGPVPQIPLDSIAPVAPQISYEKGQLTIVASNSTLGDILKAVRKQTGADIDVPEARERVVTHLGPGPAREIIAELLNGSRFNYVLLGSPEDSSVLTRVVLVQKSGPETAANQQPSGGPSPRHPGELGQQENQEVTPDADAEPPEESADDNADQQQQPAEAEQPVASPDQPGVKTPQQLLQEMQQRQLQMQQQQTGQPPVPGPGPVQQQPQPPQQQ